MILSRSGLYKLSAHCSFINSGLGRDGSECLFTHCRLIVRRNPARMMEANCKITQQKLENVVNELENCSERFVMKGSDWAEAEKFELPCCLLIMRTEIIKV